MLVQGVLPVAYPWHPGLAIMAEAMREANQMFSASIDSLYDRTFRLAFRGELPGAVWWRKFCGDPSTPRL